MAFSDLREYLEKLEAEGELKRIKAEVDWNLEIGAITRRLIDLRGPAPLFEKIKGYPQGFRVLGNVVAATQPFLHGRLALALGLPRDTPIPSLIEEFVRRTEKGIKPKMVKSGPCKEVILKGNDIDLLKFPVPLIHGMDGGRYIGSWHTDITRDPDTGWVNWGMYRHMLHDKNSIGMLCDLSGQHGPWMYHQKYLARGKPMPMAVAIGTEPVCSIVAATAFPAQVAEVEMAGALNGCPVELVKCETIDLEVPATAEIILEGELTSELKLEGPFGEFTGYSAAEAAPRPVFKVKCITHRKEPILTMSNMGKPVDESSIVLSITMSANFVRELRARGIPFTGIYVPPPGMSVIVSCRSPYPGFVHTLSSIIWGSKPGINRPFIFLVGEDVDVTNMEDVIWCLTTRLHPVRGIHVIPRAPVSPLAPFITAEERRNRVGPNVVFDATFPVEWPPQEVPLIVDFERAWPQAIREKVLSRWQEYGF